MRRLISTLTGLLLAFCLNASAQVVVSGTHVLMSGTHPVFATVGGGGGADIMVGATDVGSSPSAGAPTVTTAGVTTATSGSTFYVSVIVYGSTTISMSDDKSNNWTGAQIGTTIFDSSSRHLWRFACVACAGGAGYTVTATLSSGSHTMSLFMVEILNSAGIDQSNINAAGFVSPPVSSGSITISPPASGELMISSFSSDISTAPTITEANGFTINRQVTDGPDGYNVGAIGTLIKTAAGAYNASWSDGGAASHFAAAIDSFKGH